MKPRLRFSVSLAVSTVLLTSIAVGTHYFASRLQRRRMEIRLHDLDVALSVVQKRLDEAAVRATEVPDSTASDDFSHVRQIGDASNISSPRLRPRLLGRGSFGNWVYSDLRLPSGEVRRYYARKHASPHEMVTLLSNIRADVLESSEATILSMQDSRPDVGL